MKFGSLHAQELPFERGLSSGLAVYLRRGVTLLLVSLGGLLLAGLITALVLSPISVLALAAVLILIVLLLNFNFEAVWTNALGLHSVGLGVLKLLPFASLFDSRSSQKDDFGEYAAAVRLALADSRDILHEQRDFFESAVRQLQEHGAVARMQTEALSTLVATTHRAQNEIGGQLKLVRDEFSKALERQADTTGKVLELVDRGLVDNNRIGAAMTDFVSSSRRQQDDLIYALRSISVEFATAIQSQLRETLSGFTSANQGQQEETNRMMVSLVKELGDAIRLQSETIAKALEVKSSASSRNPEETSLNNPDEPLRVEFTTIEVDPRVHGSVILDPSGTPATVPHKKHIVGKLVGFGPRAADVKFESGKPIKVKDLVAAIEVESGEVIEVENFRDIMIYRSGAKFGPFDVDVVQIEPKTEGEDLIK